jgi:hypothetical protein
VGSSKMGRDREEIKERSGQRCDLEVVRPPPNRSWGSLSHPIGQNGGGRSPPFCPKGWLSLFFLKLFFFFFKLSLLLLLLIFN